MRICFVTHKVKKGDGQGRVNYEVIEEALRQGHQIIIISSELSEDLKRNKNIVWKRINVEKIPTALVKYQIFALKSALWIWANRNQIDITVVNGFITYARSDINCIHFVHSSWLKSKYHPFQERKNIKSAYQFIYNKLNAHLERQALIRTKQIIAVSEQVRNELLEDVKVDNQKISVITNGVDLKKFYPRVINRDKYNMDDDVIYAIFAGDLKSSRKNMDTVLQAIALVDNIHLLVVGSTEKSVYPQKAKDTRVDDRVHFLGFRDDVAELMSISDLFLFPSRYEPFSLVILEAMASGLPVITSSKCGAVELLSTQSAVIIEDPDDVSTLVNILKDLVENREKLHLMGQSAREDAIEHSWGNMSKIYLEVINNIHFVKSIHVKKVIRG